MLNLTLVRHAKSSWESGASTDHSRPLNARGLRDAPVIAKALIDRNVSPELCLVSTATRTRETVAAFIDQGLVSESCVQYEKQLYLASPDSILDVVQIEFLTQQAKQQEQAASDQQQFDHDHNDDQKQGLPLIQCQSVMVIAHNPGLEILTDNLSGFQTGPMPTAAVAHFTVDAEDFSVMNTATARLEFFITPKGLQGA